MQTRSPVPGGTGNRAGARDDAARRSYARPTTDNQALGAYFNKLKLLGYTAERHGFMVGFAKANVGGLVIDRITVFAKDGRKWCQLPAEPIRNAAGEYLHDDTGKKRYASRLSWENRDLQQCWSDALITLIENRYGPIGGAP
jgi:hypothetical protein